MVGRKEEVVETEHPKGRSQQRRSASPESRDKEDEEQQRERHGRRIDVRAKRREQDGCHPDAERRQHIMLKSSLKNGIHISIETNNTTTHQPVNVLVALIHRQMALSASA